MCVAATRVRARRSLAHAQFAAVVQKRLVDLYIHPPVTHFNLMDYSAFDTIERAGYEHTKQVRLRGAHPCALAPELQRPRNLPPPPLALPLRARRPSPSSSRAPTRRRARVSPASCCVAAAPPTSHSAAASTLRPPPPPTTARRAQSTRRSLRRARCGFRQRPRILLPLLLLLLLLPPQLPPMPRPRRQPLHLLQLLPWRHLRLLPRTLHPRAFRLAEVCSALALALLARSLAPSAAVARFRSAVRAVSKQISKDAPLKSPSRRR
jgi:hypothetical protein